jgi:hypothetical protein
LLALTLQNGKKMKLANLTLIVFAYGLSGTAVANENHLNDQQDIKNVIETFRLSIINKDKETFNTLFYSESTPWVAVFSNEMVNAKRTTNASFPNTVNFGKFGSPANMISDDEKQEEKMWDIKIDTDGYLASVHFHYSDHRNDIKKAYGTEAWDLVKDGENWKIVSVKYTVTEVPSANNNS